MCLNQCQYSILNYCVAEFEIKSAYLKFILINEGDSMTYADIMSKIKTEISGNAVLLLLRTFTNTLYTLTWMDPILFLFYCAILSVHPIVRYSTVYSPCLALIRNSIIYYSTLLHTSLLLYFNLNCMILS